MKELLKWLLDRDMSQAAFGRLVGVKQPTVWEWLDGASSPSADNLRKIAKVSGISIDTLLDPRKKVKKAKKTV